jgi:CRP/FNR family transcriptional regulator, anaerobic regulatory protein
MFDNLIKTISKKTILSENDIALCRQYFEPVKIQKNTTVEEQGKIPQYLYFISAGCMRLFYYNKEGDEVTTNICGDNQFIASYLSLINETKAKENVECITECELLRILRTNLIDLIAQSENFKSFSLIIFEQAIAANEIRANDFATLTAEQRYKKLIAEQSQIVQNVPLQYIASFLGIKSQSLSRIRRQSIL